MRRKDREISDMNKIIEIIKQCDSLNLALFDQDYPYVVPINFGYLIEGEVLKFYFHGANAGKKMALIKQNPHVAFTMHCEHALVEGEKSCDYAMNYQSVCGKGKVTILEGEEKMKGLKCLMGQYVQGKEHVFDEKIVQAVAVGCIEVKEVTGKERKSI